LPAAVGPGFRCRSNQRRADAARSIMKNARSPDVCAVVIVALLSSSPAVAEIYKCVEDGKTIYQDQPCRGAGSAITLTPAVSEVDVTATDREESASRMKAQVNEMAQSRRKRDIAYEIDSLERNLRDYERAENAELASLRDEKNYIDHNYAGAVWEREQVQGVVATKMQSVTKKYATMKQVARDRASQLRKEAAEIGKPR
jgi:hypothetical protein